MGDSLFKLGSYNRVFLEIWAEIPIWASMLKQWAVGSFFSWKYSRRAHRDPQKFIFFIKTSKWEKWWSRWLRMTYAFILCNLLWKVQKNLAANIKGSFKGFRTNVTIIKHISVDFSVFVIATWYSDTLLRIYMTQSLYWGYTWHSHSTEDIHDTVTLYWGYTWHSHSTEDIHDTVTLYWGYTWHSDSTEDIYIQIQNTNTKMFI